MKNLKNLKITTHIKTWTISLVFVVGIAFMLNACGLYNNNQSSVFHSQTNRSGEVGDGKIPDLSERLKSRPDLGDKDCDEINTCKTVCKAIYKDTDSEDKCMDESFGRVTRIEDVYEILLSADEDSSSDELEDIELKDLEDYLEIGIDGWLEVIIPKQEKTVSGGSKVPDYDKMFNTLKWINEDRRVAQILSEEDSNGEILEQLFLKYCNIDSNGVCQNGQPNAGKNITNPQPTTGSTSSFKFNFGNSSNNGSLQCHNSSPFSTSAPTNANIATVSGSNKNLLVALSFSKANYETGNNFFISAAADNNEDAFLIAHNLLSKACSGRNKEKCISAFYCWVNKYNNHAETTQNAKDEDDITQTFLTGLEDDGDLSVNINLRSCTCSNF